jgi:antitoxin HigA-1
MSEPVVRLGHLASSHIAGRSERDVEFERNPEPPARSQAIMPMKNPPHPGDFIRTEIIPTELSVTSAAVALQVSRPALSSLLNGKANLSGEMALRIEKAFGVKMDTLMRMQASYDIAQTRKREKEIRVRRFHPSPEART